MTGAADYYGFPRRIQSSDRLLRALVFRGEHDCQHARRLQRIRGVFRAEFAACIVIVDLPEKRLSIKLEAAEVVLVVGIVILREIGEAAYAAQYQSLPVIGERLHGDGHEHPPAAEGHAKGVVELTNAPLVHAYLLAGAQYPCWWRLF